MTDDRGYTITGPNAWAVRGACASCDYTTATGYASQVRAAIEKHLATMHPPRTVISASPDDELTLVATCPAGHEYWALPRGAHPRIFDDWWDAHRHHEKRGRHA